MDWGYYYYEIFKNFFLKLDLLNVDFEYSCNCVIVFFLLNEIVLEGLRDIYIFLLKIYVLVYVEKMKFVEENIIVICDFLDNIKIKVKIYCIRLFIFFDKI